MASIIYRINEIPDLTLGKYAFLAKNGVEGVLEYHRAFLRQWHEKSLLTGCSLHLYYIFEKNAPLGRKLRCYLMVSGTVDSLNNADVLIGGSLLAEYFRFQLIQFVDDDGHILRSCVSIASSSEKKQKDAAEELRSFKELLEKNEYRHCCALTKEEVFFTGGDANSYYYVPVWKENEEARLYGMFRLMGTLNEDCVFRVDLTACKMNRSLRRSLTSLPIPHLHALQSSSNGERDYGADTVLHAYDDLLKLLDTTPHFSANVFVFSHVRENGMLILSAAGTEAVEEGDFHISAFEGSFSPMSFLSSTSETYVDYSDEGNSFSLVCERGKWKILSEEFLNNNKDKKPLSSLPSLFALNEIAGLFRLPCLYDGEVIQIPKETVAPPVEEKKALSLGKDTNGFPVGFPVKLLPKHAFVSGVPGSGKTNTMHHITHSLWTKTNPRIPFLVLEPAKKEYRTLCNLEEMKELRLFSPCANMKFPLHINPFEFAKGLTVAEHIRTLCSVFEGAFPLDNPMPFLLDTAIEAVYRDMGWLPETVYTDSVKLRFPTMSMLYRKLEEEMQSTTYSAEVRGNLESALKVRIGGLLRREMGEVFDVPQSSLAPEEWLKVPAVIELEAMGTGPANFLTLMLCSLIRECLKVDPVFDPDGTRHVIFIEEAHNLIGPESEEVTGEDANAKTAATAFIVKMLAEVRALRESVFIADQLPSVMAQEVIKNTGLKIALRLTAMDDRQLLCNSMAANPSQIEDMGTFQVGEALISYEGLQRPFKMRMSEFCGGLPSEEKIEKVTPKNDKELFSLLKDNPYYRENIERSILITGQKFNERYETLLDRCRDVRAYYEKAAERIDGLQQRLAVLAAKMQQLDTEIASLSRENEQAAFYEEKDLQILADRYDALIFETEKIKEQIKEEHNAAIARLPVIEDCLRFVADVSRKRGYYRSLCIECSPEQIKDIQSSESRGENTPKGIVMFYYMKELFMQNTFTQAAGVYVKACEVLPFFDDHYYNEFRRVAQSTSLRLTIRDPRKYKR